MSDMRTSSNISWIERRILTILYFVGGSIIPVVVAYILAFNIAWKSQGVDTTLIAFLCLTAGAGLGLWGILHLKPFKKMSGSTYCYVAILVCIGFIAAGAYLWRSDISLFVIALVICLNSIAIFLISLGFLAVTRRSAFESMHIRVWGVLPIFPLLYLCSNVLLPRLGVVGGTDLNAPSIGVLFGFTALFIQNMREAIVNSKQRQDIPDFAGLIFANLIRGKFGFGGKAELPEERERQLQTQAKIAGLIKTILDQLIVLMFGHLKAEQLMSQAEALQQAGLESLDKHPRAKMLVQWILKRVSSIRAASGNGEDISDDDFVASPD